MERVRDSARKRFICAVAPQPVSTRQCAEPRAEAAPRQSLHYVHLLVEVDPQYGIHRFVKLMKGRSSRILRNKFKWLRSRLPTLWTNSYFVSTVGGAPLAVIKQYIENQKNV